MQITGLNNQPMRQDPDSYAKIYAEQNGISLTEAKEQLKEKYGDPSQESIMNFNNGNSVTDSFTSSVNNEDTLGVSGMESQFGDSNNFLTNLFGMFRQGGEGPQKEGDFNPTNETPETRQKQNPNEYAMIYAQENNLTLEEAIEELKEIYGDPSQN